MSKLREADDPVVYRIEYSLIAQELHIATEKARATEAKSGVPRATLSGEAKKLIEATTGELRRLGWRWAGGKPPWYIRWARWRRNPEYTHLGAFLDGVLEPATVVLYWSCRVVERDWKSVEDLLDRAQRLPKSRPRLRWPDLRRYRRYMRQIDRRRLSRRWHREEKNWLEDYLEILASPPRTRRPPVVRLFIKLGLSRLKPMPGPSYRVHYNLACLYSRLCQLPDPRRPTIEKTSGEGEGAIGQVPGRGHRGAGTRDLQLGQKGPRAEGSAGKNLDRGFRNQRVGVGRFRHGCPRSQRRAERHLRRQPRQAGQTEH